MKSLPQRLERGCVVKHVLPPTSRNTMLQESSKSLLVKRRCELFYLLVAAAIAATACGLWNPTAMAGDCHWGDVRAADWESPDSWAGRAVPTAGSTTYVGNYGTAHIQGTARADRLYIGSRKN